MACFLAFVDTQNVSSREALVFWNTPAPTRARTGVTLGGDGVRPAPQLITAGHFSVSSRVRREQMRKVWPKWGVRRDRVLPPALCSEMPGRRAWTPGRDMKSSAFSHQQSFEQWSQGSRNRWLWFSLKCGQIEEEEAWHEDAGLRPNGEPLRGGTQRWRDMKVPERSRKVCRDGDLGDGARRDGTAWPRRRLLAGGRGGGEGLGVKGPASHTHLCLPPWDPNTCTTCCRK